MIRKNPYQMLLDKIVTFCNNDIIYRHQKLMFIYPIDKLTNTWTMNQLYERVVAADQLRYDVVLKSTNNGLEVHYIKQIEIPIEWRNY